VSARVEQCWRISVLLDTVRPWLLAESLHLYQAKPTTGRITRITPRMNEERDPIDIKGRKQCCRGENESVEADGHVTRTLVFHQRVADS